jgi:hypothetical protein
MPPIHTVDHCNDCEDRISAGLRRRPGCRCPALVQIDPSIGYTNDNTQVICCWGGDTSEYPRPFPNRSSCCNCGSGTRDFLCGGCGASLYCGSECAEAHSAVHGFDCEAMQAEAAPRKVQREKGPGKARGKKGGRRKK